MFFVCLLRTCWEWISRYEKHSHMGSRIYSGYRTRKSKITAITCNIKIHFQFSSSTLLKICKDMKFTACNNNWKVTLIQEKIPTLPLSESRYNCNSSRLWWRYNTKQSTNIICFTSDPFFLPSGLCHYGCNISYFPIIWKWKRGRGNKTSFICSYLDFQYFFPW